MSDFRRLRHHRYRIVAAEAHSWSSVMLEDDSGNPYLFAVKTKLLTSLDREAVASLLESRAYRPWSGDRGFAPLDQLAVSPIPAPKRDQSADVAAGARPEPADSHSDA